MAQMQYRVLGTSGIKVSEICLGTMMFGGPTEEAEARRIIDHALESGVNFIDTANVYTKGRSEAVIGPAIKAKRDRWVLATKLAQSDRARRHRSRPVAAPHDAGGGGQPEAACRPTTSTSTTSTASTPTRAWEQTIAALRRPDPPGQDPRVGALQRARLAHPARRASLPPARRAAARRAAALLQPDEPPARGGAAAGGQAFGLGVVPYSPIARGVLTGKYKVNQKADPGSRAGRQDRRMLESEWRPESLMIAEKLKEHAEKRGTTLVAWAVAWVLNNRAITLHHRRPAHLRAVDELFRARSTTSGRAEDEALADSLVTPGHASTPGFNDPAYPVEGRFPAVG